MRLRPAPPRPAATVVEFALVAPLTFLILLGLIVGGLGIFRYQQVAHLSREASRWASVHGAQYAQETGNSAATAQDVYNAVIAPKAAVLDLRQLSYTVTWNQSNAQYYTTTVNGVTTKTANTVTVTITYNWIPEAILGSVTLRNSSTATMSF